MKDTVKMYNSNYFIDIFLRNIDKKTLVCNYSDSELLSLIDAFLIENLFNKKRILIITNKDFDIYKVNILNKIKDRVLNLDISNDYIEISKNLDNRINNMKDATGKTKISKVNLLIRDIDKKVDLLNSIKNIFYSKKDNQLSLIDKYNITNKKITQQNPIYDYYKIFRIKRPLSDYSYNEIKIACENIINNSLYKDYIKYRRFIDNELFYNFKKNFDYELILESIENINLLLEKNETKLDLKISKYTKDFLDLFNIQDFNESTLKDLANIVNLKYNYNLLKNKESSFLTKFFKKSKYNKDSLESRKFYSIEKNIHSEYLYNYKLIINRIKDISFLNKVLVKEAYKCIEDNVINGEDIKDSLVFYNKLLKKIYKMRSFYEFFYNKESIEEEILFYCYENLQDKTQIDKLVTNIPILRLNLEIEEEETKNSNLIDIYKDYDLIIKDIDNDVIKKDSLIITAIGNILDNVLREKAHIIKSNLYKEDFDYNYILNNIYTCVIQNIETFDFDYIKQTFNEFDKILILNNKNIDNYLNIKEILSLSENVVVFNQMDKTKDIFNDFYYLDILNMNISKETTKETTNNKLIQDILEFLKSLGYNLNNNLYIDNLENQIILRTNSNKIIIKIDCSLGINIFKDIYYTKSLESDDLFIYRVWSRDFWISREKEFIRLREFIKSKE